MLLVSKILLVGQKEMEISMKIREWNKIKSFTEIREKFVVLSHNCRYSVNEKCKILLEFFSPIAFIKSVTVICTLFFLKVICKKLTLQWQTCVLFRQSTQCIFYLHYKLINSYLSVNFTYVLCKDHIFSNWSSIFDYLMIWAVHLLVKRPHFMHFQKVNSADFRF